jgi:hypothetical protein
MAGMVGPWVTGVILEGASENGRSQADAWRIACMVPAALCIVGAAIFVALGTGERLF